jgi:glycosyltransferase involved in cell wall biosynthesis
MRIGVSIIVPVYNTGSYLHKCIRSILNQSLKDIELILVDDGSTDNSKGICDWYAEKDKRVKVIHKQNEGVSVARNIGIANAVGEYIGFVDSDDWIDPDMYEVLYLKAKEQKADIVMCDAVTKYDDKPDEEDTIKQLDKDIKLSKNNINPALLLELAGSAWRCIYKRDLVVKNNILFTTGLKFSEDRIFNILAMGFSGSMYYIKFPYYNRYIRRGSAVNKYYENMIDIVMDARRGIMRALDEAWGGEKSYKDMYENQTIGLSYAAINNTFYKDSKNSFSEKYKAVKKICNMSELRNAIKLLGRSDIRSRLIINKNAAALCCIAKCLNIKYRR